MLKFVDRPGAITVTTMRQHFEQTIRATEALAGGTPLGVVTLNGQFHHYVEPTTDSMWIGFALGMRAAERISAKTGDKK